jgi:hypothetical protein
VSYIVIKTIKGRQYRYEQRSWREGKRVRTKSRYLGPVVEERPRGLLAQLAAFLAAQQLSPEDRALASAQRAAEKFEQYQREVFGETARERADREYNEHLDRLFEQYGLMVGPIDPTPMERAPAAQANAEDTKGDSNAADDTQGDEASADPGIDNAGTDGGEAGDEGDAA